MNHLVKETNQVEIYRLQGELSAIDTLVTLPGTVREYAKGLQDKTMKPIGESRDGKPV